MLLLKLNNLNEICKMNRIFVIMVTIFVLFFLQISSDTEKERLYKMENMSYGEFKKRAVSELATHKDLISFTSPEKPFFQEILAQPNQYLEQVKTLMNDRTVSFEVKLGTAATMISLEIPELAKFVNYLNMLSKDYPELFTLVQIVSFNRYRGSSFVRQSLISQNNLSKHVDKSYVAETFRNIYNNPYMLYEKKISDAKSQKEINPVLSNIILKTL